MANYWQNRAAGRMLQYHRQPEYGAVIQRAYAEAARNIRRDMDGILRNLSRRTGLTLAEIKAEMEKPVDATAIQALKGKLEGVTDPAARRRMAHTLNIAAGQARLGRLEAVEASIQLELQKAAETQLQAGRVVLGQVVNEAYYRTAFDLTKHVGYGFAVAPLSKDTANEILRHPWSGRHWSSRVWANTDMLAGRLMEGLTASFAVGIDPRQLAREFKDYAVAQAEAQALYDARRLIHTEITYAANQAELESYRACGIQRYIFIATLDLRTSPVCRELDGKDFATGVAVPGENLPPMHPWCRSTTIMALSGEALSQVERRARDPVTGKLTLVPGNMNYEKWYGRFVLSAEHESGIINIRNLHNKGVNILMDEFTPCLINRSTGNTVQTVMDKASKKDIKGLEKRGWNFNWLLPYNEGYEVYKLKIENDDEIQGLVALAVEAGSESVYLNLAETAPHNFGSEGKYKGVGAHLFAFAGKISMEKGYNYLYFDSKTSLIEYYKEALGAMQLGSSQRMILDGEALLELVKRYYGS